LFHHVQMDIVILPPFDLHSVYGSRDQVLKGTDWTYSSTPRIICEKSLAAVMAGEVDYYPLNLF
jgi:hypothetical protein